MPTVREYWAQGERHRIPRCCRVQFITEVVALSVLPPVAHRLALLTPRHAIADGVVPWSGHALRWLLTGRKPVADADRVHGAMCCEARDAMAEHGGPVIRWDVVEVDMPDGPETMLIPQLHAAGADPIHAPYCPWCGEEIR
jgi:hypothetical protein